MIHRISLAAACCVIAGSAAWAQVGIDFRKAVKKSSPSTFAIVVEGAGVTPDIETDAAGALDVALGQ